MRAFTLPRRSYPCAALFLFAAALHAQPVRIPGSIDNTQQVELSGNAPFQPGSPYDQGPVHPSFALTYVTLYY
jgi:hypothetical protein